MKYFFWFFVASSVVAVEPSESIATCEGELRAGHFPISCYRQWREQLPTQTEPATLATACRVWVRDQTDRRLLSKVKDSHVVSRSCRDLARDQIKLLDYRSGF
jgi:hypothetical protein